VCRVVRHGPKAAPHHPGPGEVGHTQGTGRKARRLTPRSVGSVLPLGCGSNEFLQPGLSEDSGRVLMGTEKSPKRGGGYPAGIGGKGGGVRPPLPPY